MPISQQLRIAQEQAAQTSVASGGAPDDTAVAANDPSYTCLAYREMQPAWQIVHDVYAGTMRMRKQSRKYLPVGPAELEQEYRARVEKSEFFAGFRRTVRGLVGMVFRRNPLLDNDAPEELKAHWENIDGAGTHGDIFARERFEQAVMDGHSFILVDHPVTTPGATKADQTASGVRPYWVAVNADQLLSWRIDVINGETVFTQVVIQEQAIAAAGRFGEEVVTSWRVFTRDDAGVHWELWEAKKDDKGTMATRMTDEGDVVGVDAIPLVVVYGGERLGIAKTQPPLLDLAYANIAHWQVQSDHRYSLHMASVPIPVFIGRSKQKGEAVVGANVGIDLPVGGDAKYLEHTGKALGETRAELKDLEQRMGVMGIAMLQRTPHANETAEAKRLDKSEQDSQLSVAARGLGDALESAFVFHTQYLGLPPIEVTVNQEFENLSLDGPTITAFSALHTAGQVSLDTLWDMLENGNILPDGFDPDEERQKLAAEVLAMRAAAPAPDPNAVGTQAQGTATGDAAAE